MGSTLVVVFSYICHVRRQRARSCVKGAAMPEPSQMSHELWYACKLNIGILLFIGQI